MPKDVSKLRRDGKGPYTEVCPSCKHAWSANEQKYLDDFKFRIPDRNVSSFVCVLSAEGWCN